jgi:hypothetical protein
MLKTLSTYDGLLLTSVLTTFLMGENAVCGILRSGEQTRIEALLPKKDPGEDRVVMKITGVLVDMLVDINPKLYRPAVVLENQK